MLNKEFLIGINHFDLPSLFAGKLHAVLCRKYTKGRDFYDLLWYLGKKIEPNYLLLNNALEQTQHETFQLNKAELIKLPIARHSYFHFVRSFPAFFFAIATACFCDSPPLISV